MFEVFASQPGSLRSAQPYAQKDGIVLLFERLPLLAAFDVVVVMNVEPELTLQPGHLVEGVLIGYFVGSTSVQYQTGGLLFGFKNLYFAAGQSQLAGTGNARRSRAYDGHFFAVGRSRTEQSFLLVHHLGGGVALQAAYFYGLHMLVVIHAGAFAKYLSGAHFAADIAKVIGIVNRSGCPLCVVRVYLPDEQRDVYAGGTGFDAGRIVAKQAARTFVMRHCGVHVRLDLSETLIQVLRGGGCWVFRHDQKQLGDEEDHIVTKVIFR